MLYHLDWLSSIESQALPEGIDRTIHQNRLLKLARGGRKMSSRDLTRFSATRHHAILVCVLEEARATLTDEVIELHEYMLNSLFSKAKRTQTERLQQTGKLVNAQGKRPLAAYWGDGITSSSDGQNFRTCSSGRYAGQVNPKYGQELGRQFYTHISDQYSPFYTSIISRVRDSTHVLDGLLFHESELEIREHYADTASFTDHVFALMHLLGFVFCPRTRPRQEAVYQRESGPTAGASVADIDDQPESERDRDTLA